MLKSWHVWFKNIYRFLTDFTSVFLVKVMRSFMNYWVIDEVLWIHYRDQYLSCVLKTKIRSLLLEAHDQADHWVKTDTLAKLQELCYWFNQSEDVEKYIADCLKCAHHESATRSQLLNSVKISFSFQLLNMNFIDSLTATKTENKYIFNVMCYFSKKVVSFATFSVNASDVIESLEKIFIWFRKSYVIYCDWEQHFDNFMIRNFLNFEDVFISYSSSDFSKSIDMMKIFNKLLENVLRKLFKNVDWDQILNRVTKFINFRVISYLEMSSIDIIIDSIQKITSTSFTLLTLFEWNIFDWVTELCLLVFHIKKIKRYIRFRSDSHDYVKALSQKRWKDMIYKYDRNVSSVYHQLQNLIMLHQKSSDKLQFKWRDSFRIQNHEKTHEKFFILRQINERKNWKAFHENDLKQFVSCTEHLAEDARRSYSDSQSIRKSRKKSAKMISFLSEWLFVLLCF